MEVTAVDLMLDLLKQFGPLAGVVLWFIWRDGQREDRLTTRVEKLEDEQRSIILPLVEKSTDVIARNTEVMERLEGALGNIKVNTDANKPKP
jgi:ribosome maturation protein Sdo1